MVYTEQALYSFSCGSRNATGMAAARQARHSPRAGRSLEDEAVLSSHAPAALSWIPVPSSQKCLSPGHFGAEMPLTGGHQCGRFPGFPECPFALPVILALPAALPSAPSMPGSCGPPGFLRTPCQPRITWHPGRQAPVPTWPPTSGLHFLHRPSSERPHVVIFRNCSGHDADVF